MLTPIPSNLSIFVQLIDHIRWHHLSSIDNEVRIAAMEHLRRMALAISYVQGSLGASLAAAYEEVHSAGMAADKDGKVIKALLNLDSLHKSGGREPTAIYLTNMFCWSATSLHRAGIKNPYDPLLNIFLSGHTVAMEENEVMESGEWVLMPTGLRIYNLANSEKKSDFISFETT